jgi:hypothetical protein
MTPLRAGARCRAAMGRILRGPRVSQTQSEERRLRKNRNLTRRLRAPRRAAPWPPPAPIAPLPPGRLRANCPAHDRRLLRLAARLAPARPRGGGAGALGRRAPPAPPAPRPRRPARGRGLARPRRRPAARPAAPGPAPRARTIRRDPGARPAAPPPPPPADPTPEMAALLRLLELERAQAAPPARRRPSCAATSNPCARGARRTTRCGASAMRSRGGPVRPRGGRPPRPPPRLRQRRGPQAAGLPQPAPRAASPPRAPQPDPPTPSWACPPTSPTTSSPSSSARCCATTTPTAPPRAREAATQRFQSVTRAFQRIRKLRGL